MEAGRPGTGSKVRWKPIAAIAAVVLVGVAAFAAYGGHGDEAGRKDSAGSTASPSSPEKDAAHEQAVAIDKVLDESKPSRGKLQQGLSQMLHCSNPGQAIAAIQQAASNPGQAIAAIQQAADHRAEQVQQAKKLKIGALEGGDELKRHLVDALVASQQADEAYLKWAKKYQAHDCSGPTAGDAYYDAGNAASENATKAKFAFVDLWGPIAEEEGLPARSQGAI